MFDGRNVVDESTLVDALPMSALKIDGRIRTDNRFERIRLICVRYWIELKLEE